MKEIEELIDKIVVNAEAIGELKGSKQTENTIYLINHHQEIVDKCIVVIKNKIKND